MLVDVMNIVNQGIDFCFSLLQDILDSTGLFPFVIGVLSLLIFWRLVISPLFGGRSFYSGSDSVRETVSVRGELQDDGSVYYDPSSSVITRTYTKRG